MLMAAIVTELWCRVVCLRAYACGQTRRASRLRHLVVMSMLELRRVSKVYGDGAAEVHAMREVSFEVEAGTIRGVAAVVVTHDAQLAAWADRVVHIRDGRIAGQAAPEPGPDSLQGQDR